LYTSAYERGILMSSLC